MASKSNEIIDEIVKEISLLKLPQLELLLFKLTKNRGKLEKVISLEKSVEPDIKKIQKRMTAYVHANRIPIANYNPKRILSPSSGDINQWNHKLRSK